METPILDVTVIEPKLKHPTIFEKFDALFEGESFIIHNDHDPKPVYYQLLAERGRDPRRRATARGHRVARAGDAARLRRALGVLARLAPLLRRSEPDAIRRQPPRHPSPSAR